MRLDKFFSEQGICSRSEIKKELKKKAVMVNGVVITKPEYKINPDEDEIIFHGRSIAYEAQVYYMMNKPQGVVSATKDNLHPTVIDVFHESTVRIEGQLEAGAGNRRELFPVGRLDIDTQGLLLLTDDGALAHELLSPTKHIDKTYFVRVEGQLGPEDVAAFLEGLDIGEKRLTKPAVLRILEVGEQSEAEVTIVEGKFHQVKRMFAKVSKPVIFLKRIAMGELRLDETLEPGDVRVLTEEEICMLRRKM